MSKRYRLAPIMKWAGRIIGLCAAFFLLVMLIGEGIAVILDGGPGSEPVTIAGFTLVILALVALGGSIISWWKELVAAVLLILASIGFDIHIGIFAGHNHVLAWSIVGLPYIVAAVLILEYRWLMRKTL